MSQKIIVGVDGSEGAFRALDFAVSCAKAQGLDVLVCHVLEWSPYTFLTPTELEERHKRRAEEVGRAEKAILDPVLAAISESGLSVHTEIRYGHVAETLCAIAEKQETFQIVVGRTGHSALSSRLFGSVAGTLAQAAPVPVTIVP